MFTFVFGRSFEAYGLEDENGKRLGKHVWSEEVLSEMRGHWIYLSVRSISGSCKGGLKLCFAYSISTYDISCFGLPSALVQIFTSISVSLPSMQLDAL
jgi:hypothetical protein